MVFQCIAAGASLLVLSYASLPPPNWLEWTLVVFVWLAILSTIYSGLEYVIAAVRFVGHATN
jgi:CDP-diacylglycerol--glycerol-3-phosphate 3-phosphatidyltransferase